MWVAVELVFRHYQPQELEAGMLFMNTLYPSHEDKEQIEVWELKEEDLYEQITPEIMFMENGFPVKPWIIDDDGAVVSTPDEIGIFDPGKDLEVTKLSITEMNFIMREFDGLLEIYVDEEVLESIGELQPSYYFVDKENNDTPLALFRFLTDDYDIAKMYNFEEE